MEKLKGFYRNIRQDMKDSIIDDAKRQDMMFVLANLIMGTVSAVMTAVNVATKKYLLMYSTLLFAVLCFINVLMSGAGGFWKSMAQRLFPMESLFLCTFFCVSGIPEGFSALWFCCIPSFGFMVFGRKRGGLLSAAGLAVLLFLFWLPAGKGFLHYNYTRSFMLRFPMLYSAVCIMSFVLEYIRAETKEQLELAEKKYQYLYNHDALTGLFNRYGFNERLELAFSDPREDRISMMILDLDFFKKVNDTYGHEAGDGVLRRVADILREEAGRYGEISRWGGEEFTVLYNGVFDVPAMAEGLRRRMESETIKVGDFLIKITASIGVCTAGSKKDITMDRLVTMADQCLYSAKRTGRNKVVCAEI